MQPFLWILVSALSVPLAAWAKWSEADFNAREVTRLAFSDVDDPVLARTVIGSPRPYVFRDGDTLWDVARVAGLGINELRGAYPHLDLWVPPSGSMLRLPTWWVLPSRREPGIYINIPEMRLFYVPSDEPGAVYTAPVGLGRDDWQTPVGEFRISEKTVDPKWVIPRGILEERIREKGRRETFIPGGDPENPLGKYRMRLSLPLYGIHGTNIPWGVGMQVSHGCVRLYPEDIDKLFPLVPVGARGALLYEPVKIGSRAGTIYLEAHEDVYETGFDYWGEALARLDAASWRDRVDLVVVLEVLGRRDGVPTPISRRPS